MKKYVLYGTMMLCFSASAHAELETNNQTAQAFQKAMNNTAPSANFSSDNQELQLASMQPPSSSSEVQGTTSAPAPTNQPANLQETQNPTTTPGNQPATPSTTTTTITTTTTPQSNNKIPTPLGCNSHIPAETTHLDPNMVLQWAEKAAEQSFDLSHETLDKQLAMLKACFTDQGWQGFNEALEKSGNLNAIKLQKLTVSSMLNGSGSVNEVKDNQWKVTLPMQVVYQNANEKLMQPLTVNLLIGRKVSGDLGIMQMIAIPQTQTDSVKSANEPQTTPVTTPTSTAPKP